MTDEQRAELKRLAEAATRGPWKWWTSCSFRRLSSDATGKDGDVLHAVVHRDGVADIQGSETDRAFIAAANPAAVLDLLKESETARKAADDWRESAEQEEAAKNRLRDARNDLAAEVERLKAEIQQMKEDARDAAWERDLAD